MEFHSSKPVNWLVIGSLVHSRTLFPQNWWSNFSLRRRPVGGVLTVVMYQTVDCKSIYWFWRMKLHLFIFLQTWWTYSRIQSWFADAICEPLTLWVGGAWSNLVFRSQWYWSSLQVTTTLPRGVMQVYFFPPVTANKPFF